ncbi:MAG: class I SAM-dependent methyltransferase [Candidatus Methylomirabilales bacterium]
MAEDFTLYQGPRLHEFYRTLFTSDRGAEFDNWFHRYCGYLTDPFQARRFYSYTRYLAELSGRPVTPATRILDVGCGFGPACLAFFLMGSREVYGLEIHEPMVRTLRVSLEILGLQPFIQVQRGDAGRLQDYYPPDAFDLVLSNEALSHYEDVDGFLRGCYALLRPGGALVISDTNNGSNPWIRWKTRRIWARFELGPPGPIHRHTVDAPFIELRRRIIRSEAPVLSDAEVESLARETFGLRGREVREAIRLFVERGIRPGRRFRWGACPMNPEADQYMEYLFYPLALARRVAGFGFRARAQAYLGGATRGGIVARLNRFWVRLTPLTVHCSQAFNLIAIKP